MKTKPESSAKPQQKRKPQIYRFSFIPTIIKSVILLLLLLLFSSVIFPVFFVYGLFNNYIGYADTIDTVYSVCRIANIVLVLLTFIRCLFINSKKVRIKNNTMLMYRYGIIFKKTKVYSLLGDPLDVWMKHSPLQKLFKVCTVKVIGLNMDGKKKKKKLVFKNVKQGDTLLTALTGFSGTGLTLESCPLRITIQKQPKDSK